jgi:GNAT superfamily N-acetyltransferase
VTTAVTYGWRDEVTDEELATLHAAGFGPSPGGVGRRERLARHSLGWVCARTSGGELAGFVNVAWDGGAHAFLLDTVVAPALRRSGVATALVAVAVREARAAGCSWLHVDFEPHLRGFYLDACGFRPTDAGLIDLSGSR